MFKNTVLGKIFGFKLVETGNSRDKLYAEYKVTQDNSYTVFMQQRSFYKKDDNADYSNYRGISLLPATYKLLSNILLSRLTQYAEKIIGIINVDFDATGQLLILYSASVK
jgi:hypothetical protein